MDNNILFDPLGGWIYYSLYSMQTEQRGGDDEMAKVYQFLDEAGIQVLTKELLNRLNEKLNVKLDSKISELVVSEINDDSDDQHSLSARALYRIINSLKDELLKLDIDDKEDMNLKLSKKVDITDLDEYKTQITAELLLKANLEDLEDRLNLKVEASALTELEKLLKEDYNEKFEGKVDISSLEELRSSVQNGLLQQMDSKATREELIQLDEKIENDIRLKLDNKTDKSYVDAGLDRKVDKDSIPTDQSVINKIIEQRTELLSKISEKVDKKSLDGTLSTKVDKDELSNFINQETFDQQMRLKANKEYVDRKLSELSNTPLIPDGIETPPNINELLNTKLDKTFVEFEDNGIVYSGKLVYENNKAYMVIDEVQ